MPAIAHPTAGVRLLRRGATESVTAYCECGACVLPPMRVRRSLGLTRTWRAAEIVLADTIARCRDGDESEMAPPCLARRRELARPQLRLVG